MQIETNVLTYTRRDVLRASGVIAAAAATLQILPVAQMKGVAQLAPLELGVVLPRSAAYAHLSESILAGLRLYFAQHSGRSIALRTRELAPGSGAIGAAVEQLQASGPLDFLIGMVTPAVAAQLHERLVASGTVFVNATVGANVPREIDRSAHVLHSSLAHWEASWALGRWAAQHLGRRGIVATSLYDSGYDALYAFRRGFEGGGGTILATHITHLAGGGSDDSAIAPLLGQNADFVYASYSGQAAVDFVRAYARAGLATRLPLIGSSFLTDEGILDAQGDDALGIRTAATWSPDLDNVANQRFTTGYRAQTGQVPDILAVLGFETARVIDLAAGATGTATVRAAGLAAGLAAGQLLGPRGAVALDVATQVVSGPIYLREVGATATGPAHATVATLTSPNTTDAAIAALRRSPKTGWLTPYLCG